MQGAQSIMMEFSAEESWQQLGTVAQFALDAVQVSADTVPCTLLSSSALTFLCIAMAQALPPLHHLLHPGDSQLATEV